MLAAESNFVIFAPAVLLLILMTTEAKCRLNLHGIVCLSVRDMSYYDTSLYCHWTDAQRSPIFSSYTIEIFQVTRTVVRVILVEPSAPFSLTVTNLTRNYETYTVSLIGVNG